MYVKRKKNRSGTTSIVVAEKIKGKIKEHCTIGVSSDEDELVRLVQQGKEWILAKERELQPELDLDDAQRQAKEAEYKHVHQFISQIDNIVINGTQLILDRVFDGIGFNQIDDEIFRQLVLSRLSYPASKAATVEYLKNYFDEDISLSKIYRYLDKLDDKHQKPVQEISVKHTMQLFNGVGVMFYDVTTLYFETDKEDELRKTGFSKEGRHSNPQIILGLLVNLAGYPLAYTIHEGNKYEGHTMMPVIEEFVKEYELGDFTVVADSGLMNEQNISQLEKKGYKYIIGARIKSMNNKIKEWILDQSKEENKMKEYSYENGRRLLIGYTDTRARKDAYNREKGIRRLEKAYKKGSFSKSNLNKKGYNKFLEMETQIFFCKLPQIFFSDDSNGVIAN